MPLPLSRLRAAALAVLTLGSLALGASQVFASSAAPGAAKVCPVDCNTYCKDLYGPDSTGKCTPGGCLCTQPAPLPGA